MRDQWLMRVGLPDATGRAKCSWRPKSCHIPCSAVSLWFSRSDGLFDFLLKIDVYYECTNTIIMLLLLEEEDDELLIFVHNANREKKLMNCFFFFLNIKAEEYFEIVISRHLIRNETKSCQVLSLFSAAILYV